MELESMKGADSDPPYSEGTVCGCPWKRRRPCECSPGAARLLEWQVNELESRNCKSCVLVSPMGPGASPPSEVHRDQHRPHSASRQHPSVRQSASSLTQPPCGVG